MSDRKALLCKLLIEHGSQSMTTIKDALLVTEHQAISMVGELAARGVLRREGNLVVISDPTKAKMLAESVLRLPADPRVAPATAAPGHAPPGPSYEASYEAHTAKVPKLADEVAKEIAVGVTVKKGVPLPPARLGRSGTARAIVWPFKEMAVGDCFEVPVPKGVAAQTVAARLRKDAVTFARLFPTNPEFTAAVRITEGNESVGLWRVDPETNPPRRRKQADDPTPVVTLANAILPSKVAEQVSRTMKKTDCR